jgi:hypothetical protein
MYPCEVVTKDNFMDAVQYSEVAKVYDIKEREEKVESKFLPDDSMYGYTAAYQVIFLNDAKFEKFEEERERLHDIAVSLALNSLNVDFFMKYLKLDDYFSINAKKGVDLKQCSRCGEFKILEDYSPSKTGSKGRMSRCKECTNEVKRQKRAEEKKNIS